MQGCIIELKQVSKGNNSHSDKLDILDKTAIAENVHTKISRKDWWKDLASKNNTLRLENLSRNDDALTNLLEINKAKIKDIQDLSPKFNLHSFKEAISTLNDKDRVKAVDSTWATTFKEAVLPQIEQIHNEKHKAKTIKEVLSIMEHEKSLYSSLFSNYPKLSNQFKLKENNDYIHRIHHVHADNPKLLENIGNDAHYVEQHNLRAPGKVLGEIKNATYLNTVARSLFNSCQEHVLKKTEGNLNKLEKEIEVKHDNKIFKDSKSYLDHCFSKDNSTSRYLHSTKVEDHYKELQHRQLQQKQQQLRQRKEIEFQLKL